MAPVALSLEKTEAGQPFMHIADSQWLQAIDKLMTGEKFSLPILYVKIFLR